MKKIVVIFIMVQVSVNIGFARTSERFYELLSMSKHLIQLDLSNVPLEDHKLLLCKAIGQATNDASVVKFSIENFRTCQRSQANFEKTSLCFSMAHMADTSTKNQFDQETFELCLSSVAGPKKILMCGEIGFHASEDRWVPEVNPEVFAECLDM